MDTVRYCYECGSIGEVRPGAINCCPDGNHATYVHPQIAAQARAGFKAMYLAENTGPTIKDSLTVERSKDHIGDTTEMVSRAEIAWEATGNGLVKHVTDERYQKFSPEIKRWYKPYRCASCTERRAEIEALALEEAAKVCDELEENWSAYKDTALLNGDVGLSIAASGEPRAARFIAGHLRQLASEKRAGNNEMENVR